MLVNHSTKPSNKVQLGIHPNLAVKLPGYKRLMEPDYANTAERAIGRLDHAQPRTSSQQAKTVLHQFSQLLY